MNPNPAMDASAKADLGPEVEGGGAGGPMMKVWSWRDAQGAWTGGLEWAVRHRRRTAAGAQP